MELSLRVFDHIPGLFLYTNYFDEERRVQLVRQSLELYERLQERIGPEPTLAKVNIPQPKFVKSAQHNLPSEELYTRVTLVEGSTDTRSVTSRATPTCPISWRTARWREFAARSNAPVWSRPART